MPPSCCVKGTCRPAARLWGAEWQAGGSTFGGNPGGLPPIDRKVDPIYGLGYRFGQSAFWTQGLQACCSLILDAPRLLDSMDNF
jgi:hypothetical protein